MPTTRLTTLTIANNDRDFAIVAFMDNRIWFEMKPVENDWELTFETEYIETVLNTLELFRGAKSRTRDYTVREEVE